MQCFFYHSTKSFDNLEECNYRYPNNHVFEESERVKQVVLKPLKQWPKSSFVLLYTKFYCTQNS